MLGHIESYNEDTCTGVIKCEDAFYEFHLDQWNSQSSPKAGDDVNFELQDGAVSEAALVGAYLQELKPVKRRVIAALLGISLGALGLHRFYLGFYRKGLIRLGFTLIAGMIGFIAIGFLWGLIEGILIIAGNIHKDAKGRELL